MGDIDLAIARWQAILGEERVITSTEERALAEQATYRTSQRIPVILRPRDRAEVQALARVASEIGVPIYPISRGKNWGYGSRVPVSDGCALVDLSQMNRIVDCSEQQGHVTVEPGVTFRQLHGFLRERRSRLLPSVTGSTPDGSLIGNALERGVGAGQYTDRFGSLCGMEVVLANGECIRTGFGRFDGARAAGLHRWGVGPYVDGLFTQSNLGIVTQATFWLQQAPDALQIAIHSIASDDRLAPFIDALHGLAVRGILPPPFTLYNDYRAISLLMPYPWDAPGATPPLSAAWMSACRQRLRNMGVPLGAWAVEAALAVPDRALGAAQRRLITDGLRDVADDSLWFEVDGDEIDRVLGPGGREEPTGEPLSRMREMLLRKYLGVPHDLAALQVYWRKRQVPAKPDPDRDRCGAIWYSPVIPFDGASVKEAVSIISDTQTRYGFEPGLSLQCLTERSVTGIASILYDRDEPGAEDRALACSHELETRMEGTGFYPYRHTSLSLARPKGAPGAYEEFLGALKRALDPQGILAPGRYC